MTSATAARNLDKPAGRRKCERRKRGTGPFAPPADAGEGLAIMRLSVLASADPMRAPDDYLLAAASTLHAAHEIMVPREGAGAQRRNGGREKCVRPPVRRLTATGLEQGEP